MQNRPAGIIHGIHLCAGGYQSPADIDISTLYSRKKRCFASGICGVDIGSLFQQQKN